MCSILRSLELMDSTSDGLYSIGIQVIPLPSYSSRSSQKPLHNDALLNTKTQANITVNTHGVDADLSGQDCNFIACSFSSSFLLKTSLSSQICHYNTHALNDNSLNAKQWKNFASMLKEVITFFQSISIVPHSIW